MKTTIITTTSSTWQYLSNIADHVHTRRWRSPRPLSDFILCLWRWRAWSPSIQSQWLASSTCRHSIHDSVDRKRSRCMFLLCVVCPSPLHKRTLDITRTPKDDRKGKGQTRYLGLVNIVWI